MVISMRDTIITNKMMKTNHIFGIVTLLILTLVLTLVITNFSQPAAYAQNKDAIITLQQATPTPLVQDKSEIGSTDGILIMGIVIVVIVLVPVLFRNKNKL